MRTRQSLDILMEGHTLGNFYIFSVRAYDRPRFRGTTDCDCANTSHLRVAGAARHMHPNTSTSTSALSVWRRRSPSRVGLIGIILQAHSLGARAHVLSKMVRWRVLAEIEVRYRCKHSPVCYPPLCPPAAPRPPPSASVSALR